MTARSRQAVALGGALLIVGSWTAAACTDFNGLTFPLDGGAAGDGSTQEGAARDGTAADVAPRDATPQDAADERRADGAPEEASCAGPHFYTYTNHCYRFTGVDASSSDFPTAESDCRSWGGYLVVMGGSNAEAEHAFVNQHIIDVEFPTEAGTAVWVGLERGTDGGFAWVDGESLIYVAWGGDGSPNPALDHACVVQWNARFSGTWDNYKCDNQYSYICERDL